MRNSKGLAKANKSCRIPVSASSVNNGSGVPLTGDQLGILRQLANLMKAAAPLAANSKTETNGGAKMSAQPGRDEAALLMEAALDNTYRRLPHRGDPKKNISPERCPWTGLTRNQFYEIFELRENGKPVIKNVSFRKEGEAHGARLYNVGSALRYLNRLAEEQAQSHDA